MAGQTMLHSPQNSGRPRPLFIYGTLCAKPLLAWVVTGDSTVVAQIEHMLKPALARKYIRLAVKNCDYPAVIQSSNHSDYVDGYLLQVDTPSRRKKLDSFEGDTYVAEATTVSVLDWNDRPSGEKVEAEVYLWQGGKDLLSSKS
ncbi:AIG2-like protein [Akanthomyces lecanii RCEF 1005]|uniref:Putative gamma-glutamylcyclotransferase n=1 Tax=Akanthomyces lecanii RCEF 1005 TaxID=1081108 RepID=A0A167YK80_CORDF|nr:AIG2-like protein [Akanthomyces lecanii RCEF 1005]